MNADNTSYRSGIIIGIFAVVCIYISLNTQRQWNGWMYKFDRSGYHLYLPAAFIYNDVQQLGFYSYIDDVYEPSGQYRNYCIYEVDNGNRINRYNIGVAVHEAPFFLLAHYINTTWLHYAADGYSLPYEWATIIANLLWTLTGLWALRKLLLQYFTDNITAITLVGIVFGTNIYYHTIFSPGGAHCYAFSHVALIILFTDKLYTTGKTRNFYFIAASLGLLCITRPVNIIVAIIPLLWAVNNKQALQQRLLFFKQNIIKILPAIVLFIAILMIQLGWWKYVTGNWYYDGYADEGFIWTEPAVWKGLFSFRKGWLIYAPMSIFALAGIYFMKDRFRAMIPVTVILLVLFIYVTYSWWNWWYGGSFGSRPMTDITPLLALPMACFVQYLYTTRHSVVKVIVTTFMVLFTALQIFQSYQAARNVIHYDRTTAAYYFRMFFRTTAPTEEDEQLLCPVKDLYNEMNERQRKSIE